jgi:hypothetical protein
MNAYPSADLLGLKTRRAVTERCTRLGAVHSVATLIGPANTKHFGKAIAPFGSLAPPKWNTRSYATLRSASARNHSQSRFSVWSSSVFVFASAPRLSTERRPNR